RQRSTAARVIHALAVDDRREERALRLLRQVVVDVAREGQRAPVPDADAERVADLVTFGLEVVQVGGEGLEAGTRQGQRATDAANLVALRRKPGGIAAVEDFLRREYADNVGDLDVVVIDRQRRVDQGARELRLPDDAD